MVFSTAAIAHRQAEARHSKTSEVSYEVINTDEH